MTSINGKQPCSNVLLLIGLPRTDEQALEPPRIGQICVSESFRATRVALLFSGWPQASGKRSSIHLTSVVPLPAREEQKRIIFHLALYAIYPAESIDHETLIFGSRRRSFIFTPK